MRESERRKVKVFKFLGREHEEKGADVQKKTRFLRVEGEESRMPLSRRAAHGAKSSEAVAERSRGGAERALSGRARVVQELLE
ncbi:hypothetical protein L2E82_48014 [Cichorium intybus]|uniref:Uncharacterized protein n=1 Tax=Cichorium intybus TaxID=13427 RepID=A0ACB8YYK2_CICIN|nr:hypothetical protein L2E82_48014 [Cichorium intybus]